MTQAFAGIPYEKKQHLLATLLWHSDYRPATASKFCVMPVRNYLMCKKFPYIHNVMMYTLEAIGSF